jgi:hypothetical protein
MVRYLLVDRGQQSLRGGVGSRSDLRSVGIRAASGHANPRRAFGTSNAIMSRSPYGTPTPDGTGGR